jgi:hypothetical protein
MVTTYNEFLLEEETQFHKTVTVRADSTRVDDPAKGKYGKPIAWFTTKYSMAEGFSVYALDAEDKKWLQAEGIPLEGIYRYVTVSKGNTGIIKLNVKKGYAVYFDNKAYENDDKIHWDAEKVKFNRFFIEDGKKGYFE